MTKNHHGIVSEFLASLSGDVAGLRVKKYIIEELEIGRSLNEILKDPYVKNRISESKADELIANSDIINAVKESLKASLEGE